MDTYFVNLYENIFGKIANNYTHLRIISGYASASFLSRVINDFPHLKIELFLGMTLHGVSKNNHLEFQSLIKRYENINVFYQIKGKPNHMKILEFSTKTSNKIFIGSANFSENGFFNHKEVLTEIDFLPESLFIDQVNDSLICNDKSINDFIKFYDEDTNDLSLVNDKIDSAASLVEVDECEVSNELENENVLQQNATTISSKIKGNVGKRKSIKSWSLLRGRIDYEYYLSFEVTVILQRNNNPRWANKGINAWVDGRNPVLVQTPKLLFAKVFPCNEKFSIYTDDNKLFNAKLTGKFNGELEVLNFNLYDYIRERIGLVEKRPISYDDLVSNGYATMYFTRINHNEYKMSFNKDY